MTPFFIRVPETLKNNLNWPNSPINIAMCSSFYKRMERRARVDTYVIGFKFMGNSEETEAWKFDTESQRDDIYNQLLNTLDGAEGCVYGKGP